MERKICLYGSYFSDFYQDQSDKVKDKIDYVLELIKYEERVPKKFLKFLSGTDALYEIKVVTVFQSIRIFCFFDDGQLVVLTNCFIKKTKKTPKRHIDLALRLKRDYFNNKDQDHD